MQAKFPHSHFQQENFANDQLTMKTTKTSYIPQNLYACV